MKRRNSGHVVALALTSLWLTAAPATAEISSVTFHSTGKVKFL